MPLGLIMPQPPFSQEGEELVFLPLGGAGEIGMNLNLYGYGPEDRYQWLMVDLGVMFGNEKTPGIERIMADPRYILPFKDQLLGLILTHGHEDHIGAVPYLWPMLRCPIYATPFTASLVRHKLEETGLLDDAEIIVVPLGGRCRLGPFDIELITLTHSIPEPNALVLRTPLGRVLHTGDWKIDPDPLIGDVADEDCLRDLGQSGVAAMICDSTNVLLPGTAGSEGDVRRSLLDLVGGFERRVVVTCFASNVARLDTVAHIAKAHDRHLCVVGRSIHRMVDAARSAGMIRDFPSLVTEEDAGCLPPDKVLYLCTGSQGEPRAALRRIVNGEHSHIVLEEGDAVIFSSRIIPGNEVSVFELQNKLAEMGIRIITERDHFVHVSGHPCRDELAMMYQWVRPKLAIPVHGEARHLFEHAALAQRLQVPKAIVPKNGTMIRIAPGESRVVRRVANGRLYLDGHVIVDHDESHLKRRRKISYAGYVGIALAIDRKNGVLADPEIRLQGLSDAPAGSGEDLCDDIGQTVLDAFDRIPKTQLHDNMIIERIIRRAARRVLTHRLGKKPVIDVSVIRV